MSDAPTLDLSDPLAWNNSFSGKGLLRKHSLLTYNIVTNSIQTPIEHCRMLPEVFHPFTFPSCKSGVLL